LLEGCAAFEQTHGFATAPPDERCSCHILVARAKVAASLDSHLSEDERAAATAEAKSRWRTARRLSDLYKIEHLDSEIEVLQGVLTGLDVGDVKTVLRFDLPFAIAVPDGEYRITLPQSGEAKFQVVFRPPTAVRFGVIWDNGALSTNVDWELPDRLPPPVGPEVARAESLVSSRTLFGFSAVRLEFPYFIDTYGEPELPPALQIEDPEPVNPLVVYQFPAEFQEIVNVTNYFIDQVRIASGRYEIDRISVSDIEAVAIVTFIGDIRVMQIPFRGGGPYKIHHGEPSWMTSLRSALLDQPRVDTVSRLILDAHKFLLQRELRLAVFNVNAAFELFVNIHYRLRVSYAPDTSSFIAFAEGESTFETCRRELIARGKGKGGKAFRIAADLLPTPEIPREMLHRPSVHQLIKQMDHVIPFGYSRTRLSKLVNQIRYSRNEVAHGSVTDDELAPERIERSLNALQEFISVANQTLPR
jgi:hypothetical protein